MPKNEKFSIYFEQSEPGAHLFSKKKINKLIDCIQNRHGFEV